MSFRKVVIIICVVIIGSIHVRAQISQGGTPLSWSALSLKSSVHIPEYALEELDTEQLLKEDEIREFPLRYGVFEDVNLNLKDVGIIDTLGNNAGYLWRYRISSSFAKSIQIIFRTFIVPEGATLFIYNYDHTMLSGAFTKNNMRDDSLFVLADFKGNHVIIEYFEPLNPEYEGELIIGSVSQAYRDIFKSSEKYININCPEGKDLQLAKHAVTKITFQSGIYASSCSGSLINNERQDGTPYYLTANHCISSTSEASTLIAYFNYENEGCDGTVPLPLTISGSTLLTTGEESDYTLLELNSVPTDRMQPFYAGWDVSGNDVDMAFSVHHPEGLTKKLSIDYDSVFHYPYIILWTDNSLSPENTHWQVAFDVGYTEVGSSGGPLFTKNDQIIGQLHGGTVDHKYYGSLFYSWNNKPAGYPEISDYLDPDDTGILQLEGYSPATNIPDAFFIIPSEYVCMNSPVQLTDYSVFGPYEIQWDIEPSTFAFLEGTTESSANPVVEFHEDSWYTIELNIGNGVQVLSSETNTIKSGDIIHVQFEPSAEEEICDCDFDSITLTATGALEYSWSLSAADVGKADFNELLNDTVRLIRNQGFVADSTYTIEVIAAGTSGTCIDSARTTYTLLKPAYDNVAYAKTIHYGTNGLYTNECATVETGEPEPPHASCTTQLSWCDEFGTGEDILGNSVWFKFTAAGSGEVSISSTGMDNQIALYAAGSYSDILNDNYTLLSANDDRSSTIFDPLIMPVTLAPGTTYWLQVDGSAGNITGDFYLQLVDVPSSAISEYKKDDLSLFPQPSDDVVYISGDKLNCSDVNISIYNLSGKLISQTTVPVTDNSLVIFTANWDPGVYVALINTGSDILPCRIIKR